MVWDLQRYLYLITCFFFWVLYLLYHQTIWSSILVTSIYSLSIVAFYSINFSLAKFYIHRARQNLSWLIEPRGSMLHLQTVSNNPYSELNQSNFSYFFKIHSIIIRPFTPRPSYRTLSCYNFESTPNLPFWLHDLPILIF